MGRKVTVRKKSAIHVDVATGAGNGGNNGGGTEIVYRPVECPMGDTPGVPGTFNNGDILSAGTFFEWFRDLLGVNMSTVQTLRFARNPFTGVYSFNRDDWRPLDGLLLGNEGEVHNYHFTAELDASFKYDASAGQFIQVRNTDDVYVFLNGRLVIENGGMGFNKLMYIDLDRLGFTDGDEVQFQLFHAQRQKGLGIFRVDVNFVMQDKAAASSLTGIIQD